MHVELSLLVKDLSFGKPDKELRGRIKVVQRLVKALLRLESQRNALPLWNCCALLEHLLSNSAEAIKLFQAVLSQQPNSKKLTFLYHSFCECLLGLVPPLSTPSHFPPHTPLHFACLCMHLRICALPYQSKIAASGPVLQPSSMWISSLNFVTIRRLWLNI